jgi:DNA-binding response OmpR family regulator
MSPRLLVVDDDAALNLALCAHFEDRGWQATGVYDCAAALAATAGTTFEGVLLDVQLGVWGSMDTAGEFDSGAHPQKHQLGAVS